MASTNFTPIQKLLKNTDPHKGGAFSKESAPFISSKEMSQIQEHVEHTPEKEVEEYVKPRKETISLPPDIKKLGAQSTSQSQFSSLQTIHLPISDDKIVTGLHAPITSSLRWLATFAVYILSCAHIGLKKIHGKIIRVVKT